MREWENYKLLMEAEEKLTRSRSKIEGLAFDEFYDLIKILAIRFADIDIRELYIDSIILALQSLEGNGIKSLPERIKDGSLDLIKSAKEDYAEYLYYCYKTEGLDITDNEELQAVLDDVIRVANGD